MEPMISRNRCSPLCLTNQWKNSGMNTYRWMTMQEIRKDNLKEMVTMIEAMQLELVP